MSEIRWTDKVWIDNQGKFHNLNEQHEKNLTYQQIQNLKYDGFFDDIESEKDELFWETFYED